MSKNEKTRETFYLFVFADESIYEMTCAVSFKDAVWEMAKYTGCGSELLLKCLKGFAFDDIEGMLSIFNHFSSGMVTKVYVVDRKIYDDRKGGVIEGRENK